MVKVVFGKKGTSKTKRMIEFVNDCVNTAAGAIIFIDDSDQLKYDVDRKVRYINVREYLQKEDGQFFGFLAGIMASNYDISHIFIDRFVHVYKDDMEVFFEKIKKISDKEGIDFYISYSSTDGIAPDYLEEFIV